MSFTVVDLLARLQLEARRRGIELRFAGTARVRELVELAGLAEELRVEPLGEPEEREERGGLEEERHLGDPGR
jgi:Mn-dependent DtxR family transcriptional regulator